MRQSVLVVVDLMINETVPQTINAAGAGEHAAGWTAAFETV